MDIPPQKKSTSAQTVPSRIWDSILSQEHTPRRLRRWWLKTTATPKNWSSSIASIVSAYLEFAEMQARRRIPMYMGDWIETLDGFLKLSKHEILSGAGKISATMAEKKAKDEYRKYKVSLDHQLSAADMDCIKALESKEQKLLGGGKKQ